jgi:hypothetical protein
MRIVDDDEDPSVAGFPAEELQQATGQRMQVDRRARTLSGYR